MWGKGEKETNTGGRTSDERMSASCVLGRGNTGILGAREP